MTLSYHQRRSMHRHAIAQAKRYDAEARAAIEAANAERAGKVGAAIAAQAERDAAAPRDIAGLKPGDLVRDAVGWHRVVRVNAKSVTVETPWSWTDLIRHDRIVETRGAG